MKALTDTNSRLLSLAILILRCTVGVILFGAGAGKFFKWFGGFGPEMTLHYYAEMGIAKPWAYMSMIAEFVGGALLIIGLLTRPAAVAILINMLVAFVLTLPKGFYIGMASYPFSLMMTALAILLAGPMQFSLDALLRPLRLN